MNDKEGRSLLCRGYQNRFKQRNTHRIVSKCDQKYEMNRDKWTTDRNFSNKYDHIIKEICEASVAEKLDSPEWVNKGSEEFLPREAFGCKVMYHIKYPDMCIVGDEVGGNSSQKGDSNIGGTLHVCERKFAPQSKMFNKEKPCTLMGLTTLADKPLICCVTFKVT